MLECQKYDLLNTRTSRWGERGWIVGEVASTTLIVRTQGNALPHPPPPQTMKVVALKTIENYLYRINNTNILCGM